MKKGYKEVICGHNWDLLEKKINTAVPKIEDIEYIFYCRNCLSVETITLFEKKKVKK